MNTEDMVKEKIKAIRKAEDLSQSDLAEMSGIAWGTIRNIEQQGTFSYSKMGPIFDIPRIKRYLMWFFYNETNPRLGQISPTQLMAVKDRLLLDNKLQSKSDEITNEMLAEYLDDFDVSTQPEVAENIVHDVANALQETLKNYGVR